LCPHIKLSWYCALEFPTVRVDKLRVAPVI